MMRIDLDSNRSNIWDANLPNSKTSDKGLVTNMYFGRAIPVPGKRIFAISGCSDKATVTGITR